MESNLQPHVYEMRSRPIEQYKNIVAKVGSQTHHLLSVRQVY